MNRQLIEKMIRNCFYQYEHTLDSVPLTKNDYEQLYMRVVKLYKDDSELHEIVEDVVYEFLTNEEIGED